MASRADYLLALAQGLTALLAVIVAVLLLLIERTVQRHRAKDPAYARNLSLVAATSLFTALVAGLTLSAWLQVTPTAKAVDLLFGWSAKLWLWIVCGGIAGGALATTLCSALGYQKLWRNRRGAGA